MTLRTESLLVAREDQDMLAAVHDQFLDQRAAGLTRRVNVPWHGGKRPLIKELKYLDLIHLRQGESRQLIHHIDERRPIFRIGIALDDAAHTAIGKRKLPRAHRILR